MTIGAAARPGRFATAKEKGWRFSLKSDKPAGGAGACVVEAVSAPGCLPFLTLRRPHRRDILSVRQRLCRVQEAAKSF
jgi:hypothetical protein